jgi:uncharacterized protein (TIGR02246 family)
MQTVPEAGRSAVVIDPALEDTRKRFNDAFNRFDAREVASFWAEDGTLITPAGEIGRGRLGVERVYRGDVETILDGTTSTFTIVGERRLGPDLALLDLDHEMRGFKMPDGKPGTVKLHVVILAQRQGSAWQWLDARPYAFMPRQLH